MENAICEYYSNVTPKPVDWLWYPYIPFGKLTVIQGDPGEGKSTFVLNLVSLLTNGRPMPDGYKTPKPRVAIYQCAEDGMADTIKPRLEQAGADCEKVAYIIDDDIALTLEDGRIESAIKETGASVFTTRLSKRVALTSSPFTIFVYAIRPNEPLIARSVTPLLVQRISPVSMSYAVVCTTFPLIATSRRMFAPGAKITGALPSETVAVPAVLLVTRVKKYVPSVWQAAFIPI